MESLLHTMNWKEGGSSVVPEVGMGVTLLSHSDRSVGTVIEVSKSGKRFKFQLDIAHRTDKNGMSESQSYEYERNPKGDILVGYLNKSGRWKIRKDGGKHNRNLLLGVRDAYHDYSF